MSAEGLSAEGLSTGVVVRLARAEDVAEIVAIERGLATAPHWAEERYCAMLVEPQRMVWVAEQEGRVVGAAVAAVVLDEAEIESVMVDGEWQRKGIGRALVEGVMAWAKVQGATAVLLELRESNEAARGLYASMGFDVVGRRPGYYAAPVERAVLMRSVLA